MAAVVVVKDEREDGSKKEEETGKGEGAEDIAWKYEATLVIVDATTAGVFGKSNGVDGDNDDDGAGDGAGGDAVETKATGFSDR